MLFCFIFILTAIDIQAQILQHPEHKNAPYKSYQMVAEERPEDSLLHLYDVSFYHLNLAVNDTSVYLEGNVRMDAYARTNELDTILLELHNNFTVDSVLFNGRSVDFSHTNHFLFIEPDVLPADNESFTTKVYYSGYGVSRGITNAVSEDWGLPVTWTLSESFHAYEWWPAKQILTDKADSVYVYLTADEDIKAGSNGLLMRTTGMGDGRVRYEWESHYPINYYLISFAAADYMDYSFAAPLGDGKEVLVQNYVYNNPDYLYTNQYEIERTAVFLYTFSQLFGIYPFHEEKYGHCLAELGGGMEHQTMTTQGYFSYTLTAHELAHQWFGNYVTCSSWQDIWINEGFASYSEYLALEADGRTADARDWMEYTHERAFMEPTGSVYVPFEDARNEDRIFNYNLSYKKGAALLHMLRKEIANDSLFFQSLRDYLDTYKNGNASGDEFIASVNATTGNDYTDFFDSWYYGKGFPTFHTEWKHYDNTLFLNMQQESSAGSNLFIQHLDVFLWGPETDTTLRIYMDQKNKSWEIPLEGNFHQLMVDPKNKVLNNPGTITALHENNVQKGLEIYPNPSKSFLHVHLPDQFLGNLTIYNLEGKRMLESKVDASKITLNLQKLEPGIYLLEIKDEKICYRKKWIKQ